METVRGLSGFGDSIYLLAAIQQLFNKDIIIYSNYEDVFYSYTTIPYDKYCDVNYDFSYLERKEKKATNQWQDSLLNAGFDKNKIEFKINIPNLKKTESTGLVVIPIYPGFGNGMGVNEFMTPFYYEYEKLIFNEFNSGNYNIITLIDKKTPFLDLCNIFHNAEMVLCQQGWGTALAESLDIPCHVVFTERALNCDDKFINSIKPEKIFTKKTSKAIILS